MKHFCLSLIAVAMAFLAPVQYLTAGNYKSFKVSIYTRAYEVEKMKDLHWLDSTWNIISSQLTVDKIYLETHRDLLIVPDKTLEQAKRYFTKRGIEVAGGITYTINESNNFETFAYSDPNDRKKVQEIAEHTAKHSTLYFIVHSTQRATSTSSPFLTISDSFTTTLMQH